MEKLKSMFLNAHENHKKLYDSFSPNGKLISKNDNDLQRKLLSQYVPAISHLANTLTDTFFKNTSLW